MPKQILGTLITLSTWLTPIQCLMNIGHLLYKLCMVCYSVGTIKLIMCQENLKSTYYSYFHSLMTYGIIFWGNPTHSNHIFWLQKTVNRIITNPRPRESCRQLSYETADFAIDFAIHFFLLLFIVNNKAFFQMNSEIHSINTRNNSDSHRPLINLATYRMGPIILVSKFSTTSPLT